MLKIAYPSFQLTDLKKYPERLQALLDNHIRQVDKLVTQPVITWHTLIRPLEAMEQELETFFAPFSHLNAVMSHPDYRACYEACLPRLSQYHTYLSQHEGLYNALKMIDTRELSDTQKKIITDMLEDARLSGVALSNQKKERFKAIQHALSEMTNQFDNNVLDATDAFECHLADESRLQGLPAYVITQAKKKAQEKQLSGYLLTLDDAFYTAIMTHADDRALRETFYNARITRASQYGPHAGQYDNTPLIANILTLRAEEAQLLGFPHFASLSLATKMASSTDEVLHFLNDLAQKSLPQAKAEFHELSLFAEKHYQITRLAPWDLAYMSEKMRLQYYDISEELLRAYFPIDTVMQGLSIILQRLYGIHLDVVTEPHTWHEDVIVYQLTDETNTIRGFIYADLFARPHKRGGAWMNTLSTRRRLDNGDILMPIATLTCNFAKTDGKTPTLSHDELLTLFHEFGHCLQHVLTQVEDLGASGINGVEWDAVELPSQFFEQWCYTKEALSLLSCHVDTKQPLSDALYQKLLATKTFQGAMTMIRQLEFSLFDMTLHQITENIDVTLADNILAQIRQTISVTPKVAHDQFANSFSHIFSSGYAAGYYSYKWAEVLSSDAFSRFEEEGIFNQQTGRDFLHCILEKGGSIPAKQAFIDFRKRPPMIEPLLRHCGIRATAS